MADFYNKQDIDFKTKHFKQEYEFLDTVIGEGANGSIYICKSIKEEKCYALKCLEDDEMSVAEIHFLQKCKHKDHLVSLRDVFFNKGFLAEQSARDNYFFLVMELMDGTLLEKVTQGVTESNAAYLAREILLGLMELHEEGIIHRDIKLENILYKNTVLEGQQHLKVAIADLGTSVEERNKPTAPMYSELYGAPEIIAIDPYLNPDITEVSPYDHRVDIWSFGVLLYMVLSKLQAPLNFVNEILIGQVEFPDASWGLVSNEAKDLICHILQPDPTKRPTLDEILCHPWFKLIQ